MPYLIDSHNVKAGMAEPSKAAAVEELEGKNHGMRWSGEDWRKMEDAAKAMSERTHIPVGPTDIIRAGAKRFADEILGQE